MIKIARSFENPHTLRPYIGAFVAFIALNGCSNGI